MSKDLQGDGHVWVEVCGTFSSPEVQAMGHVESSGIWASLFYCCSSKMKKNY